MTSPLEQALPDATTTSIAPRQNTTTIDTLRTERETQSDGAAWTGRNQASCSNLSHAYSNASCEGVQVNPRTSGAVTNPSLLAVASGTLRCRNRH